MTASLALDGNSAADIAGVPVRRTNASRSKRAKSELTRARLCASLLELINDKPLRSIKVSELTGRAGVAASTFYIYFADLEEAVLALIADLCTTMPDFALLARRICQHDLFHTVRALVSEYLEFWDRNYAVLRIRNLAADEGDARFREARVAMVVELRIALGEKITELRPDLPAYPSAASIASVILGSLERLASIVQVGMRSSDEKQELIDAEVFMIVQVLSGACAGAVASMGKSD